MNEWAKLETFFFPSSYSYQKVLRFNHIVNFLGTLAQVFQFGKARRLCYYAKEFATRNWGNSNKLIPDFLLFEIFNNEKAYRLNLESRANNQIWFRTVLKVNAGYNRFLIPSSELKYQNGYTNYLSIYPEGNGAQVLNIISLELLSFKKEWFEKYLPSSDKKVKCVVWDLDGTLWNGILAEDGIEGVQLKQSVVNIIKLLDAKGIINSISSKNYEDKALEALKRFGLDEYFVCPAINWNAKSQNIKNIARTLNISLDTFVFVDDSFFELNEVRTNCLYVRTCDVKNIEEFVNTEAFDVPVSEESRMRRKSYQEIALRNQTESEFDDITDFLKSCAMKAFVAHPSKDELLRCYELVQRTNQLNISAERLSFEQIEEFVSSPCYDCYRIKVSAFR